MSVDHAQCERKTGDRQVTRPSVKALLPPQPLSKMTAVMWAGREDPIDKPEQHRMLSSGEMCPQLRPFLRSLAATGRGEDFRHVLANSVVPG